MEKRKQKVNMFPEKKSLGGFSFWDASSPLSFLTIRSSGHTRCSSCVCPCELHARVQLSLWGWRPILHTPSACLPPPTRHLVCTVYNIHQEGGAVRCGGSLVVYEWKHNCFVCLHKNLLISAHPSPWPLLSLNCMVWIVLPHSPLHPSI